MKQFLAALVLIILLGILISCEFGDRKDSIVEPEDVSLEIDSPTSDDTLYINKSFEILWKSNTTKKLNIEYSADNGSNWQLIAENVDNSGSYTWENIPNIPTYSGKIRIYLADSSLSKINDGNFVINYSSAVQVLSPNGGEVWSGNSEKVVQWISKDIELVNLEYTVNNGLNWISIDTNVTSTGEYIWNPIPNVSTGNAKVRIYDASNASIIDESDYVFKIQLAKAVTVTSPNGGEEWNTNQENRIEWLAPSVENVNIEYTIDDGITWYNIASNLKSTGAYSWNPPDTASGQARVRIFNTNNPSEIDVSDSTFSLVVNNDAILNLISPNGGESFIANTSSEIKWSSKNVEAIKIEFSPDNGANWETITKSTPSTGKYTWAVVPNISSTNCAIKISDVKRPDVIAVSENPFTITNQVVQTLTVISPNGDEEWVAGTPNNITWQTNVEKVSIDYSVNNGITWISIIENLPSQGAYEWVVPGTINSTSVKVRVKDAVDGAPVDESDGSFIIGPKPEITSIISPVSDDVFSIGEDVEIKWTSTGIQNVGIKYTTTNGMGDSYNNEPPYYDLVTNLANEGSYTTRFNIASDEYFIVIYDASAEGVQAQSGNFTVADISSSGYPNSIRLVSQSTSSIGISGSGSLQTANLVFEVLDSNAVPIDKNHVTEVSFSIINGPGGDEYLTSDNGTTSGLTNAYGRVTVSLTSGTKAGTVMIMAELIDNKGDIIRSAPVPMTIHGGWPDADHFSVAAPKLNYPLYNVLGEEIEFTALVGDEYSNAVKPGTDVYFRTDAGVISGHAETDALGRATDTLVSGAPWPNDDVYGPGYFRVYASTMNKDGQEIETSTLRLFSGYASISIDQTSLNIPDGGSQTINFHVWDGNHNPLSEGTKITIAVNTEGDADISGISAIELADILLGGTDYSVQIVDTKPGVENPVPISLSITVDGDNGKVTQIISGTTR